MKSFFERRRGSDLERELRRNRPEPRPEFLAMLSDRIERKTRRRTFGLRVALVGAVTAAMLVGTSLVGGFAYASSAGDHILSAAKTVIVAPLKTDNSKGGKGEDSKKGDSGKDSKDNKGGGKDAKDEKGGKGDKDDRDSASDKEYGHKVLMCHNPGTRSQKTIEVDKNAVAAHLAQGDKPGACRE